MTEATVSASPFAMSSAVELTISPTVGPRIPSTEVMSGSVIALRISPASMVTKRSLSFRSVSTVGLVLSMPVN